MKIFHILTIHTINQTAIYSLPRDGIIFNDHNIKVKNCYFERVCNVSVASGLKHHYTIESNHNYGITNTSANRIKFSFSMCVSVCFFLCSFLYEWIELWTIEAMKRKNDFPKKLMAWLHFIFWLVWKLLTKLKSV